MTSSAQDHADEGDALLAQGRPATYYEDHQQQNQEDTPTAEIAAEESEEVTGVFQTITENFTDTLETIVEGAQAVVENVQEAAEAVVENVQEAAETVVENVQEAAVNVVENVQEAAENVVENVQEAAEIMKDAIAEEAHGVAEVFVDDLHEADDGDLYFLGMGLFRNLSILPADVEYAAHHPQGTSAIAPPKDDELEDEVAYMVDVEDGYYSQKEEPPPAYIHRVPIIAYFLLMTAVVSLSSIGPLLDVQQDATPTSKLYWRMAGTSMLLLPFATRDAYTNGVPHMNKAQWITFLLATFFYCTMCLCFVLALDFTSVGTAVILANSQALLLIVGKLFVGAPVSFMEGSGAIVAFSGAILCSKDASGEGSTVRSGALIGDFLAILSSFGGVGYLVFAQSTRAHMTLFVFMFLTMSVGCLMILFFQIFVMGEDVTFDMERETGIWSFLNLQKDRLPLELTMVVVCNLLGTMGYVRSMQYFDNLVISTAGLMEPGTY
jgi:drug/metabolite transporter (DMT)-like permease